MRILIRPGNGAQRNTLPADLARHIRKDGKGRGDRRPLLGVGGADQQEGGGEKDGATKHRRGPLG